MTQSVRLSETTTLNNFTLCSFGKSLNLINLPDVKSIEFDKIKEIKENEIKTLIEKMISEGDKYFDGVNSSNKNKKNKLFVELVTLKKNLNLKENSYKNIIKTLLSELRNLTTSSNNNNNININLNTNLDSINISNVLDQNDSLVKEINEMFEDSIIEESKENNNN